MYVRVFESGTNRVVAEMTLQERGDTNPLASGKIGYTATQLVDISGVLYQAGVNLVVPHSETPERIATATRIATERAAMRAKKAAMAAKAAKK